MKTDREHQRITNEGTVTVCVLVWVFQFVGVLLTSHCIFYNLSQNQLKTVSVTFLNLFKSTTLFYVVSMHDQSRAWLCNSSIHQGTLEERLGLCSSVPSLCPSIKESCNPYWIVFSEDVRAKVS